MPKCDYPPQCDRDSHVCFMGRQLCGHHWRVLADLTAGSSAEATMLKNIGLERVTVNVGAIVSEVRECGRK